MKHTFTRLTLALLLVLTLAACGDDALPPAVTLAAPPTPFPAAPTVVPPSVGMPGTPGAITAAPNAPGATGPAVNGGPRSTAQANPNAATATLTEVGSSDAKTLNPVLIGDPVSDAISRLFYNGLVTIDAKTGNPLPDLAESWTMADDGLSFTFTLRANVKWSDGQAVIPDDVAFTYNLYLNRDANSPHYTTVYTAVQSVGVTGNRAVKFLLRTPAANFLNDIATFPIVP